MQQGKVGTIRLVIPWGALAPDREGREAGRLLQHRPDPGQRRRERGSGRCRRSTGPRPGSPRASTAMTCDPGCGPYAPTSDEALAAWKDFIDELVDRYGPDGDLWTAHPELDPVPVRTWQIWNEQNSPTFYQPEVDPASYETRARGRLGGDHRARPRRRGDPRRDVRDAVQGQAARAQRLRLPARALRDRRRPRAASTAVAVHPYAAHEGKIESRSAACTTRSSAPTTTPACGSPRSAPPRTTGPNPLDRGPEGQARAARARRSTSSSTSASAWNIKGVTWYSWRDTQRPEPMRLVPRLGPVRGGVAGAEAGLGRVHRLHRRLLSSAAPTRARPARRSRRCGARRRSARR